MVDWEDKNIEQRGRVSLTPDFRIRTFLIYPTVFCWMLTRNKRQRLFFMHNKDDFDLQKYIYYWKNMQYLHKKRKFKGLDRRIHVLLEALEFLCEEMSTRQDRVSSSIWSFARPRLFDVFGGRGRRDSPTLLGSLSREDLLRPMRLPLKNEMKIGNHNGDFCMKICIFSCSKIDDKIKNPPKVLDYIRILL